MTRPFSGTPRWLLSEHPADSHNDVTTRKWRKGGRCASGAMEVTTEQQWVLRHWGFFNGTIIYNYPSTESLMRGKIKYDWVIFQQNMFDSLRIKRGHPWIGGMAQNFGQHLGTTKFGWNCTQDSRWPKSSRKAINWSAYRCLIPRNCDFCRCSIPKNWSVWLP